MKNSYFARILAMISICAIFLASFLLPISASSWTDASQYFTTVETIPFNSLYIKDSDGALSYKISTLRSEVYNIQDEALTSTNSCVLDSTSRYATVLHLDPNCWNDAQNIVMGEIVEIDFGISFKLPFSSQPTDEWNRMIVNASAGVLEVAFYHTDRNFHFTVMGDAFGTIPTENTYFQAYNAGESFMIERVRFSGLSTEPSDEMTGTYEELFYTLFPDNLNNWEGGLEYSTILSRSTISTTNYTTPNVSYRINVSNPALHNYGGQVAGFNLVANDFVLQTDLPSLDSLYLGLEGFGLVTNLTFTMDFSYTSYHDYVEQTDEEDYTHFYEIKGETKRLQWSKAINSSASSFLTPLFDTNFGTAWTAFLNELNANGVEMENDNIYVSRFSVELYAHKSPIHKYCSFFTTYNENKAKQQQMTYSDWYEEQVDILYWTNASGSGGEGTPPNDEDVDFISWIISPIDAFLNTPFFGFFSLSTLIWVVIGIGAVFAFLKYFAGG